MAALDELCYRKGVGVSGAAGLRGRPGWSRPVLDTGLACVAGCTLASSYIRSASSYFLDLTAASASTIVLGAMTSASLPEHKVRHLL